MKATKVLIGAGFLFAALSRAAAAQDFDSFGQNKVQYRTFQWQIIQTEHFDVYFYPVEREAALDVARIAERSYARLSRILHHNFIERKPILLYASYSEFQETNALGGESPSEGVEGVTEFFKHRMVIPFTGSYDQMEHVIEHEMTHQFQYDVYSGGHPGAGIQTMVTVNPPGWFMEGMAEYLSLGPMDPATTMALRDAALQGHLPTIEDMTDDPNIFPYFYGHALWAYIGQRWGDEVVGEILQASRGAGIEGAFKRALGISIDELSKDWRDAVQATFLPQISDHYPARRIAEPLLTEKRSGGPLHLAPAISPDGRLIAYFGANDIFIDLYLADAETGKTIRRLVKSTTSSNYESLRFIYSSGSFSPDGRYFAIAVKHKDRDDLVIFDIKKDKEAARLRIPLNGVNNPTWSPDGNQLAFTGFDGGLADLYVVNRDGSGLKRLTNDKYADLLPQWSPDGKTIAFSTDRGPNTNFGDLAIGNFRIALYHLESGQVEVLDHMDYGRNINPVWAPDGRSLAFVSDRTGIPNVFLYDFSDKNVYQLTDVYTGVSGITPISPALSWAKETDRLAFAYYDDGSWDVYAIDNPRSLRGRPYAAKPMPPVGYVQTRPRYELAGLNGDTSKGATPAAPADTGSAAAPSSSIYRAPSGLRQSGAQPAETTKVATPVSVKQLLDSNTLSLPDTAEFSIMPYHVRYTPDYVARPTIGYERDNFGRGFFGGTAISLSDILGDRTMIFSGAVNGRLAEAEVLAAYINQVHRTNWIIGFTQEPYYFYEPSTSSFDSVSGAYALNTNIRRFVIRDMFGTAAYPFSQFSRVEFSLHAVAISDATLQIQDIYATAPGCVGCGYGLVGENVNTLGGVTNAYAQPSAALVHDNALFGWVGPLAGSRWRFEVAPTLGSWKFTSVTADWRHYFLFRPFSLAVRGLYFGRTGRDAGRFPTFLGSTALMTGYTAGSFQQNECVAAVTSKSQTGCAELDQLIGSQVAVANVELRFPLTRALVLGVLPVGFPPLEGAFFYDAGVAFDNFSQLKWTRTASESPDDVRIPLRSYGFGIRANLFGIVIMRIDYTKPLNRPNNSHAYWTLSLGPTF